MFKDFILFRTFISVYEELELISHDQHHFSPNSRLNFGHELNYLKSDCQIGSEQFIARHFILSYFFFFL